MHPVWWVREPQRWPTAKPPLSFSVLRAIETCPLQWALTHASFPDIWDKEGYPESANRASLAGRVVHESLEAISLACERGRNLSLVETLKTMGGISDVITTCLSPIIDEMQSNPRTVHREDVARELTDQLPQLKQKIQQLLSKLKLGTGRIPNRHTSATNTHALRTRRGLSAEVWLRDAQQQWIGKADLINVTDVGCEITDFKTGAQHDEHVFQLQLYCWLWLNDTAVNPDGVPVVSMRLAYPNQVVTVAVPTSQELLRFRDELSSRARDAIAALDASPPVPAPTALVCPSCAVRHLCTSYWGPEIHNAVASGSMKKGIGDVQVRLRTKIGPSLWLGDVEVSAGLVTGAQVTIRIPSSLDAAQFVEVLDQSRVVRCTDVLLSTAEDGNEYDTITFIRSSEVFRLT